MSCPLNLALDLHHLDPELIGEGLQLLQQVSGRCGRMVVDSGQRPAAPGFDDRA